MKNRNGPESTFCSGMDATMIFEISGSWISSALAPEKEFYPDKVNNWSDVCAKTYRRRQDLKTQKRVTSHFLKHKTHVTKTAVAAVIAEKRKKMQNSWPKVKWGSVEVDNWWQSKYLGVIFQADGGQFTDVMRQIDMAKTRFGKMSHIWSYKSLYLWLRLRLYVSSVCSVLTDGSEAWNITEVWRKINDVNSVMLSVITGNTPRQQAVTTSCSFNLVHAIRARRLQWIGHILCLDEDRILYLAVKDVYEHRCEGDIMMDVSKTDSWWEMKIWEVKRQI